VVITSHHYGKLLAARNARDFTRGRDTFMKLYMILLIPIVLI